MKGSLISLDATEDKVSPITKGYVFLSYVRQDQDFVDNLKKFLRDREYAYWDYRESDRDYQTALYIELEKKIENASAFFSILSDEWRDTEWTAKEYIYAKEANIPIFVIQAKPLRRPVSLLLNEQTRIVMTSNVQFGFATLEKELKKKGL